MHPLARMLDQVRSVLLGEENKHFYTLDCAFGGEIEPLQSIMIRGADAKARFPIFTWVEFSSFIAVSVHLFC